MNKDENIKSDIKEIDLGTILSLKQQQDKLKKTDFEVGLLKQRIINMTECISNHEARIQDIKEYIKKSGKACISVFTILGYDKRVKTIEEALKKLEGDSKPIPNELMEKIMAYELEPIKKDGGNSVPNGETVFVEKPPMDERGKGNVSLQNSTPECMFYNPNYCVPCKSPDNIWNCKMVKIGRQIYLEKFIEQIPDQKKPRYEQISDMITESIDKLKEVISHPQKIDKKRVRNALNKCFNHTLTYKGIIQVFPNATYHIDGKDVVKLYEELGIKNEKRS